MYYTLDLSTPDQKLMDVKISYQEAFLNGSIKDHKNFVKNLNLLEKDLPHADVGVLTEAFAFLTKNTMSGQRQEELKKSLIELDPVVMRVAGHAFNYMPEKSVHLKHAVELLNFSNNANHLGGERCALIVRLLLDPKVKWSKQDLSSLATQMNFYIFSQTYSKELINAFWGALVQRRKLDKHLSVSIVDVQRQFLMKLIMLGNFQEHQMAENISGYHFLKFVSKYRMSDDAFKKFNENVPLSLVEHWINNQKKDSVMKISSRFPVIQTFLMKQEIEKGVALSSVSKSNLSVKRKM